MVVLAIVFCKTQRDLVTEPLVGKKSPRRRAVNRGRDDGWAETLRLWGGQRPGFAAPGPGRLPCAIASRSVAKMPNAEGSPAFEGAIARLQPYASSRSSAAARTSIPGTVVAKTAAFVRLGTDATPSSTAQPCRRLYRADANRMPRGDRDEGRAGKPDRELRSGCAAEGAARATPAHLKRSFRTGLSTLLRPAVPAIGFDGG
jgi:hypothetical protein